MRASHRKKVVALQWGWTKKAGSASAAAIAEGARKRGSKMVVSGQVTIPTGGGPIQLSTVGTLVRFIAFQNNAAGAMFVGAPNASAPVGYGLSATGGTPSLQGAE